MRLLTLQRVKQAMDGKTHVYTGNGKGKTTAALGLALRAIGHKKRVYIIQFLKGGTYIGEYIQSKRLRNLTIKQFGKPCPYSDLMMLGEAECGNCRECFMTAEEDKTKAEEGIKHARKIIKSGEYDLVILDEVNVVVKKGLITAKTVLDLMKTKPKAVELVLTGRGAPKGVIAAADVVTEMKAIKHPEKRGTSGRMGVEY